MKIRAMLVVVVVVVVTQGTAAQTRMIKLLSSDQVTTLDANATALKVSVAITARDARRSDVIGDRGEPGQFPDILRIILNIEITVNGSRIVVPHSAYADLLDVRQAEIGVTGKNPTLILRGGDGAESFIARIDFDKTMVRRRAVFASVLPGKALEETIYHRRILQND